MSKLNEISKALDRMKNKRSSHKVEVDNLKANYIGDMLNTLLETENTALDYTYNSELNRGLKIIDDKISELKNEKLNQLSGKNYPEDAILLNGMLKLSNEELQQLVDKNKSNMLFIRMAQDYAEGKDMFLDVPQTVEERIAYIEDFRNGYQRVLRENAYSDDTFGAEMMMSREVNPKLYEAFGE